MLNIKNQKRSNKGFTLIELMTVVVIMVILATVMVINLAGQRAGRDIKIAQNQLVSNIRQAQSYTLSARTLPSGESVQFYALKFDLSKPTQYTLEAIYNVGTGPQMQDIQTINLPQNIQIATITPATYPIVINRLPANDRFGTGNFQQTVSPGSCTLIAFSAPFGKVIFNGGCNPSSPGSMPYTIQSSDDYEKIVNFQINTPCDVPANSPACSASTDSIMTITLTDTGHTVSKTVTVNAITGSVSFN
jgi:prepilin-type N-terminal cleavage/methylation domain-containing protein